MVSQWKAEKVCLTTCKQSVPLQTWRGPLQGQTLAAHQGRPAVGRAATAATPAHGNVSVTWTPGPGRATWPPSPRRTPGALQQTRAYFSLAPRIMSVEEGVTSFPLNHPAWEVESTAVRFYIPHTQLNALSMQLNKYQLNRWINEWKKPPLEPSRKH